MILQTSGLSILHSFLSKAPHIIYRHIMIREHLVLFYEEFTHLLQSLENSNKNIYLAGDYNLKLIFLKKPFHAVIFYVLSTHALPTRRTDRSGTLVDNVFCKSDQLTK